MSKTKTRKKERTPAKPLDVMTTPLTDREIETMEALNRTWREMEYGEEADLIIEAGSAMRELYGEPDDGLDTEE